MTTEPQKYGIDTRRELAHGQELQALAGVFCENRSFLARNAGNFGLNPSYLQTRKSVTIGPFVNASPLPTIFMGDPMNVRVSQSTSEVLANYLRQRGYQTHLSLTVPLGISQFPTKGPEALNCLFIPKNRASNRKLPLVRNVERGTAYESVNITTEDLQAVVKGIQDSLPQFMDRFPYLRRQTKAETTQGKKLLEEIIGDLEFAFMTVASRTSMSEENAINYLDYINELNAVIARRLNPDYKGTCSPIDSTVYDDFMRNGIADIAQFTRVLASVGTFDEDRAFVKIIGQDGKTKTLNLLQVEDDDVVLQYADNQATIRYSQLLQQQTKIAPTKNISYILCFGSFVPVIYGDDNVGGSYPPYADAESRLQRLGLSPVLYNIQAVKLDGYDASNTIFDFYSRLLGNEKIL